DKPVAIDVAVIFDPCQCPNNVRPNAAGKVEVTGSLKIFAGQKHKKRSRIDRSVVAAERHFARRCHFAGTGFVKYLAGFRITLGIFYLGLRRGKIGQHTSREFGLETERLECGDDPVPPEGGAVPWHARVWIGSERGFGAEHVEVGTGAAQPEVETVVRGGYFRPMFAALLPRGQCALKRVAVILRPTSGGKLFIDTAEFTGNRNLQFFDTAGFQIDSKICFMFVESVRDLVKAYSGTAIAAVQAVVFKSDCVIFYL